MKKIFHITSITLFSILIGLIILLSTLGYETNQFNKFISEKIIENNKDIDLKLEKIRFKFDIKSFDLFLETKNPNLIYKNIEIPIKDVKVYLDFISIIKSNTKINKINVFSKEMNIDELKNIIIKSKPSNLNSLILNKVKKGKLVANLELYFNDKLSLDNFIARGDVKDMEASLNKNIRLEKTSFNFFSDNSDILIKNIKSEMEGLLIQNGNLRIDKNEKIVLKTDFNSQININKKSINKYLSYLENIKFINNKTILKANLDNYLNITFDKTFKVINYVYTNKGKIDDLFLKFDKTIESSFLEKDTKNLFIKNSNLRSRYASDKKNNIKINGIYSLDSQNYNNFNVKSEIHKEKSNIELDLEFDQSLKVDFINYKKDTGKIAKIFLKILLQKNSINFKELNFKENENLIFIKDLNINKGNVISFKKIKVKTFNKNKINNDFSLDFNKEIKIVGNKYDAENINKFLNQKSKKSILDKISKDIYVDLKNINTPLSKKLKNFRLIGSIKNGKFVKVSSKGDFGNDQFLDISIKSDIKNKKKYLEIYSDSPQPLLSEYSFFKGLSDGILTFSSIIEEEGSSSKLIIDNFKVVNAPGVVKLLALADFGGLADLAEGEGLSFDKMEINMASNKGFIKLNELYAVGPSISVLMEGYKEDNGLVSLRGTLVPAKNLNKLLSKIPVIGKIIIPKEIGEGLFGVSFKMKGKPGKIKTTINPLKTLTPRFITKALEKSKQSK